MSQFAIEVNANQVAGTEILRLRINMSEQTDLLKPQRFADLLSDLFAACVSCSHQYSSILSNFIKHPSIFINSLTLQRVILSLVENDGRCICNE